jgi:hypothetical protein
MATEAFLDLFAKRRVYCFRVDPKFGEPTKQAVEINHVES